MEQIKSTVLQLLKHFACFLFRVKIIPLNRNGSRIYAAGLCCNFVFQWQRQNCE